MGITIGYTSGEAVRARMGELVKANARKLAEQAGQDARRALRLAAAQCAGGSSPDGAAG